MASKNIPGIDGPAERAAEFQRLASEATDLASWRGRLTEVGLDRVVRGDDNQLFQLLKSIKKIKEISITISSTYRELL